MKNRVCTLYRVSTDKQVDHNDKNQADIPMQRKACRAFCDKMGWTIVHEEQEEGVSGHKVRAENRDKLQIIKQLAKQKKFDILLVFMFDRIGRIADETPFVVEWFVKQGSAAEPLPAAEAGEAGAGAAVQICKPAATGAANLGHGKRT